MSTPVISVIVVTYNHERFIEQALDSVLKQQVLAPYEILISEDASTDSTTNIVERYASRYPQIRLLLSRRNLNSGEVTMRAVRAAQGEFVAVMDGDDYWLASDKLQRQLQCLRQHPQAAVCFHDISVVDEHGAVVESPHLGSKVAPITTLDDLLGGCYVPGSSPLIRRQAIVPAPEWVNGAPYNDWALLLAAARNGTFVYMPDVLSAYRKHPGGVWSSLDEHQQIGGIIGFYDYLEPQIWPDTLRRLQDMRIAWRLRLLESFGSRDDDENYVAALDEAVIRDGFVRAVSGSHQEAPSLALQISRSPHFEHSYADAEGSIDEVRRPFQGRQLTVRGWGQLRNDDSAPVLLVECDQPIDDVVAVRLPRPDVASLVDSALDRSGFWITLKFQQQLESPLRLFTLHGRHDKRLIGAIQPAGMT